MAVSEKAYIETEGGERIYCMFNPNELSITKANTWQADTVPGKAYPELHFAGGGAGSMSLGLQFNTTGEGKAVTKYTNKLMDLMKVDETLPDYDSSQNSGRPPWIKFHWGDMHSFKAIIENISVSFTYFSDKGMPLRAKVDLSLKQYEPDANWGPQNPTSGTPNPNRTHRISPGDTLDRIAARYYNDATAWRTIADANGIADPLDLPPGLLLAIPERKA